MVLRARSSAKNSNPVGQRGLRAHLQRKDGRSGRWLSLFFRFRAAEGLTKELIHFVPQKKKKKS